ncbi:hypothetical protein PCE1_000331 [Barthelona sp. PCE]
MFKIASVFLLCALIFFAAPVRADIPVHCLYSNITNGDQGAVWRLEIAEHPLEEAAVRRADACSNFQATTYREFHLIIDNGVPVATDMTSKKKYTFSMIYDEGVIIYLEDRTIYWFLHYSPDPHNEGKFISDCTKSDGRGYQVMNEVGTGYTCVKPYMVSNTNGPSTVETTMESKKAGQKSLAMSFSNKAAQQTFDPARLADLPEHHFLEDTLTLGLNGRSQGQCGSCHQFSQSNQMSLLSTKAIGEEVIISTQHMVEIAGIAEGCDGGMPISSRFFAQAYGVVEQEHLGYLWQRVGANIPNTRRHFVKNVKYIGDYYQACTNGIDCEKLIMEEIVAGRPVEVSLAVPMDLYYYNSDVPYPHDVTPTNDLEWVEVGHSVLLNGYGTTEDGIPYWVITNSWGGHWNIKNKVVMNDGSIEDGRGMIKIDRRESIAKLAITSLPVAAEFGGVDV